MSGLILSLLEKDPSKRPDADHAKRDLKAAARQAQAAEDAESPDGATPKEGRPALTAGPSAEVDPRLKELARKADLAKLLSKLGRNWPWLLAGAGLLFLIGAVVWMMVTPTVPPLPKAATPIPIPRKNLPPPAVKPLPPKEEEPAPPVTAEEPAPPAEEPPAEPAKDPEAPKAEKRDGKAAAALKQEKELQKWRQKMREDLAYLDSKVVGDLQAYKPAVDNVTKEVEAVTDADGQKAATASYRAVKAKIAAAEDKLTP